MRHEVSILDELIIEKNKPKSWGIIIVLSTFYLSFLLWLICTDFLRSDPDTVNILVTSLIVLLPVTGLVLHITGKRIGWIINSFYYGFIGTLAIILIIESILKPSLVVVNAANIKVYIPLITTIPLSVFLSTVAIRQFFKVNTLLWIISLLISAGLALSLIFFVLKK